MSLTSLYFLVMVIVAALVYYALPVKIRWIAVLASNLFFLYKCNSLRELVIWGVTAIFVYFVALFTEKTVNVSQKKLITMAGVVVVAAALVFLKDASFFGLNINIASPIGISYYSLSWIAYMLDSYWGTCPVEKNPLKFLAFAGYFPVMTSGPIMKYQEVGESITKGNRFEFKNIIFGSERILWGLMKKLIIADRISPFVDQVYNIPQAYPGIFIWIATAFFVIQLYTDFSGCVDIALGTAEIFGIRLPENFDLPFISETLEEFWRRWHITLGGWLRDYILYPILKSSPWQKLTQSTKKTFGKKYGKKIPVWLGLCVSWFLVGFWHGGHWNYIFGVGLMFGFIIILGEALEPVFKSITTFLHINTEAFSWKLFRILRTWFFFGLGLLFFRALGFMNAIRIIRFGLSTFNPWILFDGSLYYLGLSATEFRIFNFFMLVIIIGGLIRFYTKKSLRELLAAQNLLFQWIAVILLIFAIIVYGCYGEGFSSASFIYQGF